MRRPPVSGVLLACSTVACSTAPPASTTRPQARVLTTVVSPSSAAPPAVELVALQPLGALDVDPKSFDFRAHPDVVARIGDSPHAYFRFTQRHFARAACERLGARAATGPRVRLHGDPHIEQFFVSDGIRGLADFDDAAVGPPALDLARFTASVLLAARLNAFDDKRSDELVGDLFRGYRAGLGGAKLDKKAPGFAAKLTEKFKSDRKGFVLAIENTLDPVDAQERSFVEEEIAAYVGSLGKGEPKRPATFFDIKNLGRTKLGVGSALTRKYIVRLEGKTTSDDDDLIVELKEIVDMSAVPCVEGIPSGAADARLAMQQASGDKELLKPALLPDGKFWVNEWLVNYEEARIKKLMPADLHDLVYEAGIALANVHLTPLPGGSSPSAGALAVDAALEADVRKVAAELTEETVGGWQRFKRDIEGR